MSISMNRIVITLCGSTRFKTEYNKINSQLTLKGIVVFSVGSFVRNKKFELKRGITEETIRILDQVHRWKIDLSDGILVLNKDGYIGDRTKSEIQYAKERKKNVFYLERPNLNSVSTNILPIVTYMEYVK